MTNDNFSQEDENEQFFSVFSSFYHRNLSRNKHFRILREILHLVNCFSPLLLKVWKMNPKTVCYRNPTEDRYFLKRLYWDDLPTIGKQWVGFGEIDLFSDPSGRLSCSHLSDNVSYQTNVIASRSRSSKESRPMSSVWSSPVSSLYFLTFSARQFRFN